MQTFRLVPSLLASCCLAGLAQADEAGDTAMDTIVVTGERPARMNYDRIIAAAGDAAAADFARLRLSPPPRAETGTPASPAPRSELALSEPGRNRS